MHHYTRRGPPSSLRSRVSAIQSLFFSYAINPPTINHNAFLHDHCTRIDVTLPYAGKYKSFLLTDSHCKNRYCAKVLHLETPSTLANSSPVRRFRHHACRPGGISRQERQPLLQSQDRVYDNRGHNFRHHHSRNQRAIHAQSCCAQRQHDSFSTAWLRQVRSNQGTLLQLHANRLQGRGQSPHIVHHDSPSPKAESGWPTRRALT